MPSVIEEIRDESTRSRVETQLLPFLTLRSPKSASIKFVQDFARKTGDLEVLSRTDIHLIALAYELECERNGGDWRLRNTPGQKRINGAPPVKDAGENTEVKKEEQSEAVEVEEKREEGPASKPELIKARPGAWGQIIPETQVITSTELKAAIEPVTVPVAATHTSSLEPSSETQAPSAECEEPADHNVTEHLESDSGESDEDGGGWITPSNIHKLRAKESGISTKTNTKKPQIFQVALLTSDYAMQNVLLRIGLNLLSPKLARITTLKTYVLRCHACFTISKIMEKQFCPRCGQPTLLRTTCQINGSTGEMKVFLKRNMQWSHRGDKFSIPKPTAGSTNGRRSEGGGKGGWGRELVLAEDQKEYERQMVEKKRASKKERSLMDEDYLPSLLSGDRRGSGGRITVGGGRNINSRKRQ